MNEHNLRRVLLAVAVLLASSSDANDVPSGSSSGSSPLRVDRSAYQDRLEGFWLGGVIANWTGLPTENAHTTAPFLTDEDWGTQVGYGGRVILDYQLDHDPWGADDDTDIEYIYQHALEESDSVFLSGEQIASEWRDHIRPPLLWVSNLAAAGQMQNGATPPATSLPENNPMWDMIDAQLTTEIFGALAPGRPDVALRLAHLPIRTTAYLHSEWAAEFYVVMHALVPLVPEDLTRAEQVLWLADQARRRVPDWSYIADMYDFVRDDWRGNPDKDDWEATRDRVYERYQLASTSGYVYKYPWDSGINFAASIVSLLYGEGDFKKTVRIGTLSGWDSDNPTATWGGLLGLLYGRRDLEGHLGRSDLSQEYWIARTRPTLPRTHDSIPEMAARGVGVIDRVVEEALGGDRDGETWVIPTISPAVPEVEVAETPVPWRAIEDDDPRWHYDGFTTLGWPWASGATFTRGTADCRAEITFSGRAVQLYAFRNAASGTFTVTVDEADPVFVDLHSEVDPFGHYYAKVFEAMDLAPGDHTLRVDCDPEPTAKWIDMLWVMAVPEAPTEIDIKPWSEHNFIYPFSRLLIPVALLGSDDFDVADVDVTTLAFGPNGAPSVFDLTNPFVYWLSHWDVNQDGVKDLLSHYRTEDTGIAIGDTEACLTGETQEGAPFEGCDVITTVPCGHGFEAALVVPPLVLIGGRIRRRRRQRQDYDRSVSRPSAIRRATAGSSTPRMR